MICYSTFLEDFEGIGCSTTLFHMVALLTSIKEITLALFRDDLYFWQDDKITRIVS